MERWQEPNRWGSSPLTRGKLWASTRDERASRLIPAHAGKTPTRSGRSGRWAAHPRSRGENTTLTTAALIGIGSSPLTRGKPSTPPVMWYTERLIPAHAGKTTVRQTGRRRFRAHPRSRGENDDIDDAGRPTRGSSPLTRGKRLRARCDQLRSRLIPAHAGKTTIANELLAAAGAHPRSRGENRWTARCLASGRGSSPLTRGKHHHIQRPAESTGLIPAHAGKTCSHRSRTPIHRAHPRSRGENPHAGAPALPRDRLIPAHAGKTQLFRMRSMRRWAHPRSRGENCASNVERKPSWGSSPLTRGKRRDRQIQEHPERLIPAHAGKTAAVSRTTTSLRAHPRSRGENKTR